MLKMRVRILSALLVVISGVFLTACPPRRTIAEINRDPARYAGKDITIAGRVTNSFGAMGTGVFELDDGTGRMWVYSQSYGVPGKDAKVAVTGRIQQGFSIGGRSFATILHESERRH